MTIQLQKNTVHIYQIHLNAFFDHLTKLRLNLNEAEIQKADRFHFEKHKKRYAVSQSLLRILLAEYTNLSAKKIEFLKGKYGKPFIEGTDLKFNVTHSNEHAMYAFTLHDELGIDMEYWRERSHIDEIINSNFSELEQKLYHQLPEELKIAGFYQGWTCNEAFIKAIGMGLSFPLNEFSVEMDPRKQVKLLAAKPQETIDADWTLHKLSCPEFYSAALATKHPDIDLSYQNPEWLFDKMMP